MIPHAKNNEVHMSGADEGSAFKFVMNAHMASLMSDKMYKDKVSAVIRELCCNAQDSHIDAGNPDPISVHLPTALEPWFSVEDNGVGLDGQEVLDLFTTYGASTKRESNKVVGAFGIGSKVGFAYIDQFTVVATKDGVRRTYSCYKDKDGMPRVTQRIADIHDNSLQNGVKIEIPVHSEDINEFPRKAVRQLRQFIPYPRLNMDLDSYEEDREVLQSGNGWTLFRRVRTYGHNAANSVVMGWVEYPIDISQLPRDEVEWLRSAEIEFTVPLGAVEPSASREELSYTPETIKTLMGVLNRVKNEIGKDVEKQTKNVSSIFEKKKLVSKFIRNHPLSSVMRKWAEDNISRPIDRYTTTTECMMDTSVEYILNPKKHSWSSRSTNRINFSYSESFQLNYREGEFVVVTAESKLKNTQEVTFRALCESKGWNPDLNILFIRAHSPAELDTIFKEIRLDTGETTTYRLEDVTDNEIQDYLTSHNLTVTVNTTGGLKVKTESRKMLHFVGTSTPYYQSHEKEQWKRLTQDRCDNLTSAYYFQIKDNRFTLFPNTSSYVVLTLMKQIGIIPSDSVIVGYFSSRKNPFLEDNRFINGDDVYNRWLKKISSRRMLKQLVSTTIPSSNKHLTDCIDDDIISVETDDDINKLWKQIRFHNRSKGYINYDTFQPILPRPVFKRLQWMDNNRTERVSPLFEQRMEAAHEKYPLLPVMLNGLDRYSGSHTVDQDGCFKHFKLYVEKVNE